ncbi:MAG TPA: ComEC/Rec2 family competence protein [Chthoniobacter sp.]|nr:ComEC/Rec2 family competence protein [Chthoniobacter sp.]
MMFRAPLPRKPFLGLAIAAVLGIFAADRLALPVPWALGIATLGLLVTLLRPTRFAGWLFCAAIFFELHTFHRWDDDARWLAGFFASGPRVVQATGIVWKEPEKPATWPDSKALRFVVKLESIGFGDQSLAERGIPVQARVNVSWAGEAPAYGDRITFTGSASNLEPQRNPGEFDSTGYQQRLGVFSEIHTRFPADCTIDSPGHGNPVQALALQGRHWVQRRLEVDLIDSPEIMAVIDGVVLGLRGESPEELKTLLQRTGTIHLFVVSGLNIAMLATIVFFALKPFGLPRGFNIVVVILVLMGYTLITGMRTSSVRSTIMATLLLSASLFDRRAISVNSLAAAAVAILAFDTNELFAPGFQFSFVLVFVIIVSAGRIQRWLEARAQPDPFLPRVLWSWPVRCGTLFWHWISVGMGVVLASWLGSLVFTVGYFHLFSPGSIVANFLAVPVAFLVLSLGLAAVLSALFSLHATVLFNNANWFAAKLMLLVLRFSADLPSGYVYVETPRLAKPPRCELTVFALNDGGAAHIRADGQDWLLDCADEAHYNHTVLPYLRSRGVNRLDGLLLTHGNVKHMGAATVAIGDFRPALLAESILSDKSATRRKLHNWLAGQNRGKGLYMRNDFIQLGRGASLRVLYPPAGIKRTAAADMALVLQLQCGRTRALFMSASGFSTEQWLIENEPDLRSDILIKGQNAKDLSGTPDFLAHVAPKIVVCSPLGYGEPVSKLDAWEAEAAAQGITVFRQDKTGAVHIDIRDDGYEARAFLGGKTFRR